MSNLPKGWQTVGDELPQLKGMAMPKEIKHQVLYNDNILHSDAELNKVMTTVEKSYNIWRRNVTVAKLGFHARQSIGNIFQNTLAGVTAPYYAKAFNVLHNPEKYADVFHEAIDHGVMHTGQSASDMLTGLKDELAGRTAGNGFSVKGAVQAVNPLSQQFVLGKIGRKAGEWEDNVARLAHYMWAKDKGMTPQAAQDSVRKYLFNYSEINSFGRAMRGVMPFYSWMRNNMPFQIMQAIKQPAKYAHLADIQQAMQAEPDHNDLLDKMGITDPHQRDLVMQLIGKNGDSVLPEYIRNNYVNTGGNNYWNVSLPSNDLAQLKHPIDTLMNGANPFAKTAFEMQSNQKLLNGAPIDKYAPQGQSAWNSADGLKYLIESLVGGAGQVGTGAATGNLDGILKGLGANVTPVDPQQQLKNMIYDTRNNIQGQVKKAKDQAKGK
jgi:hypothetical protein